MESKILFFMNYLMTVKHASKNTLECYRRDLEGMKEYFYSQGITELEKITATSINSYILYMEKQGKSPATIARVISSIKTFFRCMINNGYVKREPTENVNVPELEKEKTRSKTISKAEVKKILDSIEGEDELALRDKAMIELLYDAELKVSQIINLKVEDVNLDYNYVTVRGTKKDKTLPFGWSVNKSLMTYGQLARDKFLKEKDEGFLFMNCFGKQMTRQGFWKIFKKCVANAKLSGVTTHSLHK
ncbi:MAG: tyrosine-type recombinase/integrase [Lachnospiraceae bacterium]|nr:tyrosine-type recombinase/integrase [Lachnospiraceae bacterium]